MSMKLNIHNDIKNKLKYFVDTNKIPHIIFHGESGSGKREIVNFLINTIYDSCYCNEDYIKYVNCAHGKGIRFIRDDLKYFAKTNINTNVKFKSIILFNADKLTIDAQSALRRCIEKFSCSTRFFIVVEDKNKLLKPILSRFCNIYIPLPNIDCEFQSLHNYNRKNIQDNPSLKKHTTTLIKLIKRRNNYSSIENCNNLTEKLYQRGYSALDIMKLIENDNKIPKKEKYTALIYFDKIRKEFRNEKLLMLLIFYKFFMRKDINLENIDEM